MSRISCHTLHLSFQYFPTSAALVWLPLVTRKNGNQKSNSGKMCMVRNVLCHMYSFVLCTSECYILLLTGFRMSCMRDEILSEAAVDLVDRYSVISSSDTFKVGNLFCIIILD